MKNKSTFALNTLKIFQDLINIQIHFNDATSLQMKGVWILYWFKLILHKWNLSLLSKFWMNKMI
jgi:hypothetical protein